MPPTSAVAAGCGAIADCGYAAKDHAGYCGIGTCDPGADACSRVIVLRAGGLVDRHTSCVHMPLGAVRPSNSDRQSELKRHRRLLDSGHLPMQIVAGSLMALLLVVAYLHGMSPAARPRYSIAGEARADGA
jgi:hypothetical protein